MVASTSASCDTSHWSASAVPPASSISCTVPLARSRSTSATTTLAPSSAKRSDVARPTPEPPPMTTIDFPSSCMLMLPCSFVLGDERDRARGTRLNGVADRFDRVTFGVDDDRLGLVVVRERARRVDDAHAAAHAQLTVDDDRR